MSKILVTGGCGYIGSHTVVDLIEHGFEVVVIDSLERTHPIFVENIAKVTGNKLDFHHVNLCDLEATKEVFEKSGKIDGVIHFAAYKAVSESTKEPFKYYRNNIGSLTNVLDCIAQFNVANFVFSSSCSVYGNAEKQPVTEQTPTQEAECAYAATKQIGEIMSLDMSKQFEVNNIMLRYFNPIGAHKSGLIGDFPHPTDNALIPYICKAAIGEIPYLSMFGTDYPTRDGTCIRDYIHVSDIAHAHTLALQYLQAGKNESKYEVFNVGTGRGSSVKEMVAAFEKANGMKVPVKECPRRPGDVDQVFADYSHAKNKIGWEPKLDLVEMMRSAWQWHQYISENDLASIYKQ